jgi:hypothetical protein
MLLNIFTLKNLLYSVTVVTAISLVTTDIIYKLDSSTLVPLASLLQNIYIVVRLKMELAMAFDTNNLPSGDMPWDLRTIYANFIVGPSLFDMEQAHKARNFQKYWEELHNLNVVVRHKIKSKENKDKKDTFEELKKKALTVINKYPGAFLGTDHSAQAMQQILDALEAMEMFLYEKMDEAKLFGGKKTQDSFM